MTMEAHKRLPNFEVFDRIELVVVPRFKTSELSGDEWRQSVIARCYFKGEMVHECGGWHTMRAALELLPGALAEATCPIPMRVIAIEAETCDQPSCQAPARGRHVIKRQFSERGELLDPSDIYSTAYRKFCVAHADRGDCSREDCDANYERTDGVSS